MHKRSCMPHYSRLSRSTFPLKPKQAFSRMSAMFGQSRAVGLTEKSAPVHLGQPGPALVRVELVADDRKDPGFHVRPRCIRVPPPPGTQQGVLGKIVSLRPVTAKGSGECSHLRNKGHQVIRLATRLTLRSAGHGADGLGKGKYLGSHRLALS